MSSHPSDIVSSLCGAASTPPLLFDLGVSPSVGLARTLELETSMPSAFVAHVLATMGIRDDTFTPRESAAARDAIFECKRTLFQASVALKVSRSPAWSSPA